MRGERERNPQASSAGQAESPTGAPVTTAYGAVLALTGFHYSGVEKKMKFKPLDGKYFWANGQTYGTVEQKKSGNSMHINITVLGENPLILKSYEIRDYGIHDLVEIKQIKDNIQLEVILK